MRFLWIPSNKENDLRGDSHEYHQTNTVISDAILMSIIKVKQYLRGDSHEYHLTKKIISVAILKSTIKLRQLSQMRFS